MAFMDWGPALSVGIPRFDDEHRRLVGMLNDLHDAVQAGHGAATLGPVLSGLVVYTLTHFEHEEQELERHGFPGLAAHKAEHDALTAQVAALECQFDENASPALAGDVAHFLRNWLAGHILGTDQDYTAFLIQHVVR